MVSQTWVAVFIAVAIFVFMVLAALLIKAVIIISIFETIANNL